MKDKLLDAYKFISQVLITFSVTLLFITINGMLIGENAKELSSLFSLGNKGIAFETVLQLLLSSFIVSLLSNIFFSEKIFKNMMTIWKGILTIISIIIAIVIFVICFKWFPLDFVEAWVGFFVSFAGFLTISIVITVTKTNREAKKYDELLEKYKKRQAEGVNKINESN